MSQVSATHLALPLLALTVGCARDPELFLQTFYGVEMHAPSLNADCVGFLGALNQDSGLNWVHRLDGVTGTSTEVGLFEARIFDIVTTPDGDALFYDDVGSDLLLIAPDGSERWRTTLTEGVMVGRIGLSRSGVAYVTAQAAWEEPILFAVDLDGTVLHSTPTGQQDIVAMAIGADDTVYLGGKHVDGTELVAIDANGDVLWRTAADHQILTISLGRDFVLVNRFHDELGWRLGAYSLDGELLWERGDDIIPSSSQQGSIGADGTIYIGALEKADSSVWLYALDGSNGETLWKAGHSCSKVAIGDNGKLYTVCLLEGDYGDGWHFVALDADDGEITWQYELQDTIGSGGGEIHNAPVMCAGKAYWGIGYYQSLLWGFDHMPYLDPDAPWPRDFGNNANNSQVQ